MGPISKRERGITHSELITRSKSLIYRSVKEEGSGALYGINGQKVVRSLAVSFVRSDLNGDRDGVVAGENFFRDAPLRFAKNHFIISIRASGFGTTEERRGGSAVVKSGSLRLHSARLRFRRPPPPWRQNTCRSRPGRNIRDAEAVVIISYLKRQKREVSYSS